MSRKGTIAIEEACLPPDGLEWLAETSSFLAPGKTLEEFRKHAYVPKLLDIHEVRLQQMDAEGVDFMLLSVTSPGCQGERDPKKAAAMAVGMNEWLSGEVAKNPKRFGGLASLSMHDPAEAAAELKRAVKELGMFGAILNDFQTTGEDGHGRKYFDGTEYDVFWEAVQELDVPVYLHPRFPSVQDTAPDGRYGPRKQLLGAGVSFHLELSFHLYAICSGGVFDRFPKVQVVVGHLGEG
jgi:2,3-dihydroxybenzoate decarboxylase